MSTDDVDTLAAAQRRFLDALLVSSASPNAQGSGYLLLEQDWVPSQTPRGWMAYLANAQALAKNTLTAAYPVIAALLGDDTLAKVAQDLWQKHPPERGDLAQWGAKLPDWLANCHDLAALPYLQDVARTEWALHRAATAADAPLDTPSFARLTQEDPAALTLSLAPGLAVLCSRFPVVSLIAAHRPEGPDFAVVAQRLRDGVAESALVWREGLAPRLTACDPPATALISALLRGASLLQALEETSAVDEGDAFDFSAWLQNAVATGLVLGVQSLEIAPSPSISREPLP